MEYLSRTVRETQRQYPKVSRFLIKISIASCKQHMLEYSYRIDIKSRLFIPTGLRIIGLRAKSWYHALHLATNFNRVLACSGIWRSIDLTALPHGIALSVFLGFKLKLISIRSKQLSQLQLFSFIDVVQVYLSFGWMLYNPITLRLEITGSVYALEVKFFWWETRPCG